MTKIAAPRRLLALAALLAALAACAPSENSGDASTTDSDSSSY
jgi:hypothetical protein